MGTQSIIVLRKIGLTIGIQRPTRLTKNLLMTELATLLLEGGYQELLYCLSEEQRNLLDQIVKAGGAIQSLTQEVKFKALMERGLIFELHGAAEVRRIGSSSCSKRRRRYESLQGPFQYLVPEEVYELMLTLAEWRPRVGRHPKIILRPPDIVELAAVIFALAAAHRLQLTANQSLTKQSFSYLIHCLGLTWSVWFETYQRVRCGPTLDLVRERRNNLLWFTRTLMQHCGFLKVIGDQLAPTKHGWDWIAEAPDRQWRDLNHGWQNLASSPDLTRVLCSAPPTSIVLTAQDWHDHRHALIARIAAEWTPAHKLIYARRGSPAAETTVLTAWQKRLARSSLFWMGYLSYARTIKGGLVCSAGPESQASSRESTALKSESASLSRLQNRTFTILPTTHRLHLARLAQLCSWRSGSQPSEYRLVITRNSIAGIAAQAYDRRTIIRWLKAACGTNLPNQLKTLLTTYTKRNDETVLHAIVVLTCQDDLQYQELMQLPTIENCLKSSISPMRAEVHPRRVKALIELLKRNNLNPLIEPTIELPPAADDRFGDRLLSLLVSEVAVRVSELLHLPFKFRVTPYPVSAITEVEASWVKSLAEQVVAQLSMGVRGVTPYPVPKTRHSRSGTKACLETAIANHTDVVICYRELNNDRPLERRISPCWLETIDLLEYVWAYCFVLQAERYFSLARIDTARPVIE